jgi:hypothetical protein
MMEIRYLVLVGALLAIIEALPVPAAGQNDVPGVTKFNGVWVPLLGFPAVKVMPCRRF